MRPSAPILLLVACLAAAPAMAVDLDSLSRQDRRIYCAAYVWLDDSYDLEAGRIDDRTFAEREKALTLGMMKQGDNYNYARDFRRMQSAAAKIIVDDTPIAVAEKADLCRTFLRL